ncbi:MAG: DNA double-strand break repair nuclease NurA [Nanoarchaeota archaeon]
MIDIISHYLREKFKVFFLTDNLIFHNTVIPVNQENFAPLVPTSEEKTIAFIDGGQAEILSGGNLCVSFIRVFAQVMKGTQKVKSSTSEFYVVTTAVFRQGDIWYEGKIFPLQGQALVDEAHLIISSHDQTIRAGTERAPISKISSLARRFAELALAKNIDTDYILLDGTLEPTFKYEEMYLAELGNNVSALAKTDSLFTTCGNNPTVLLQKLSPHPHCWSYFIDGKSYFVKLHPSARHVFRFEGNSGVLPCLLAQSTDPLFLGYPYGLIVADKMARISNAEKDALKMSFLLRDENRELAGYLNAMNAHDILDRLG